MPETNSKIVLSLRGVDKSFRVRSAGQWQTLWAVRGVDLDLVSGQVHGIVGESGSGKSTLARLATALYKPDTGEINWGDKRIDTLSQGRIRRFRSYIQMVFQDPFSSLNPRQRVDSALLEPLKVHNMGTAGEQMLRMREMANRVGLTDEDLGKYPHQFSGGQRQRICIARALMLHPTVVVLDEAVSALDVSIQAQILSLLQELQGLYNLSYLFISHDLEVIKLVADHVSVMYAGRIVESGPVEQVYGAPKHPYTKLLLDSRPSEYDGSQAPAARVEPQSSEGCPFAPRCASADSRCNVMPDWSDEASSKNKWRCWHPLQDSVSTAP